MKYSKKYNPIINELLKKRIYGILKLIAFLIIFAICLQTIRNILIRKDNYRTTYDFFSQKENFDVLFFGNSHVINGIYPMELWNKYGIVSFNLANHSERMILTYYNMQLALKNTKPKLIVVDIYLLDDKRYYKKEYIHTTLDCYPVSYIKYLAVNDMFEGKNLLNNEFEYLFPFSMYHARWNELKKEDFLKNNKKLEKGAETRVAVSTPKEILKYEDVKVYDDEENINMKYLRKIIEYCNKNEINILVTHLPHPASQEEISVSKYVKKICDEYNINYINFLNMDIVNYNIDCYDEDSHLNPSGARKVTAYLGNYIMEHYDIPNQRNNEAYNFWKEDYDEYIDFKINNLEKQENSINNYLMLLYDEKDIKYEIKLSSKKNIENGSVFQELLENLNNNYEIDDEIFKENEDKTVKITTWDNRTGELIKEVWF